MVKQDEKSKLDTVSNLQPVADQINTEFAIYKELEKDATKSMLKIGLMLEYAKETLPHGQLMKWAEKHLTITYRHANHFRKLAQYFIKANKLKDGEAFALVDPANSQAALADKLQQMAFEFMGDKTQAELFAEYGIQVREPKKLGGDHGGGQARSELTAADRQAAANVSVGELCTDLQSVCIGDRRCLPLADLAHLKVLEGDLVDALKNVREIINAG